MSERPSAITDGHSFHRRRVPFSKAPKAARGVPGGLRGSGENAQRCLRIATFAEAPGFMFRAHVCCAASAETGRTRGVSSKQYCLIHQKLMRLILYLSVRDLHHLLATAELRSSLLRSYESAPWGVVGFVVVVRRPPRSRELARDASRHKRRRPPGFPWAAFRERRERLLGFRLGMGLRALQRDRGAIQETEENDAGFGRWGSLG